MPTPKLTRETAIRFARLHIDGAPDPDVAVKVAELWQAGMYSAPPGAFNLMALKTSRAALNNPYALVGTDPKV
jgi:hypothetical protein